MTKFLVIDIEDIVGFLFRNDKGVAFRQGVDVEERKKPVVLSDFIARDFTGNDSGKDAWHSEGVIGG